MDKHHLHIVTQECTFKVLDTEKDAQGYTLKQAEKIVHKLNEENNLKFILGYCFSTKDDLSLTQAKKLLRELKCSESNNKERFNMYALVLTVFLSVVTPTDNLLKPQEVHQEWHSVLVSQQEDLGSCLQGSERLREVVLDDVRNGDVPEGLTGFSVQCLLTEPVVLKN